VANLTPVKDQTTLVKAFAILRRDGLAKLRFVGPDFLHGQIHRLVADLGLADDVEFVGAVPHAQVAEHYRWADMFVLTSLSEGQNGALTEAITCGVLPVSTWTGLATDLGPEAAVIVKTSDPADVAQKIRAIAADPVAWESKAHKARAWAEAHDLTWTVAELGRVIRGLTSEVP
jgi:glycosyltransferase involved in cell wall biosynthesis